MDGEILNLEQATGFLGVSEKTMIKLLREEHIPARKIGREWRFSKKALLDWLAGGDSLSYINQSEPYRVSKDIPGTLPELFDNIGDALATVKRNGSNIRSILDVDSDIVMPETATLRINYKQQRDVEKLEFKIYWNQRENTRYNQKSK